VIQINPTVSQNNAV